MLLAIDVGNTNIVLGIFEGQALVASWRLATLLNRTADELWVLVSRLLSRGGIAVGQIDGVIVSSVVPPLTRAVSEMLVQALGREPLLVNDTNAGLPIRYENPADVGADRLADAVGRACAVWRARAPGHRRQLWDGDDVRCRLGQGVSIFGA